MGRFLVRRGEGGGGGRREGGRERCSDVFLKGEEEGKGKCLTDRPTERPTERMGMGRREERRGERAKRTEERASASGPTSFVRAEDENEKMDGGGRAFRQ